MRLTEVEVFNFQSVRYSNPIIIDDAACLLGKNEAGKTAILQALYRLNPIVEADGVYDFTEDFPRAEVDDYEYAVESGARQPAKVVCASFSLAPDDLAGLAAEFGRNVLIKDELTVWSGYSNSRTFRLEVDETFALKNFIDKAKLSDDLVREFSKCESFSELSELARTKDPSDGVARVTKAAMQIQEMGLDRYIYLNHLRARVPKFVYFDEYYLMNGYENLEALKDRVQNGQLHPSDYPMLGLIHQARLNLDQLLRPRRTQQLVNKLEAAGFHLSKKILLYWSQNKHLKVRFDVRPGQPEDPEGMRAGTNIWAGIYDSQHMVSTHLGERSRGFLWFFSFLAWYAQLQTHTEPLILLLDEPGLSLHVKAQQDLLRYFEEELIPNHQLIYTTHSPFMIDREHMGRVHIVEDEGADPDQEHGSENQGTKVFSDLSRASSDSLFPLVGALGYDIYSSLFVGHNSFIVEDIAELLYFQAISALVEEDGRPGLSSDWTIIPIGGIGKIDAFVSLLTGRENTKIATILGAHHQDRRTSQDEQTRQLLKKGHVLRFADFATADEADMEDMFDPSLYLRLVNGAYQAVLQKPIYESDMRSTTSRILLRLREYFRTYPLQQDSSFSRYQTARYLVTNMDALKPHISTQTRDRFANVFLWLNSLL